VKYLLDTDHITFLQERHGPEYAALSARIARHPPTDFTFPVVSFHEQTLGGHALLNRARTTADLIRGYALLLEILQTYTNSFVLSFDAAAAAVFGDSRHSDFVSAQWICASPPSPSRAGWWS
jgi:tRNA(fMet)-specific endonuclease VapC